MSSPKDRENNDLTTRHNKRIYNSMSSPKHIENNDLTTRHNKRKYNSMSSPQTQRKQRLDYKT